MFGTLLYFIKISLGSYRRKEILELFKKICELFNIEETDEDLQKILVERLKNSLKLWKVCTKWGLRTGVLSISIFGLSMRFNEKIGLIIDIPRTNITSPLLIEGLRSIPTLHAMLTGHYFMTIELAILCLGIPIATEIDILEDYIRISNDKIKTTPNFFKKIIKMHCNVLGDVNLLNETFSEMTFIQFFSSIVFFLIVFLFLRKGTENIDGYLLCLCALMQLLPLCLLGEFIRYKTDKLSDTLYLTNWYELSLKDQKVFLIILGMAQREYGLKAAGMYEVNLSTFIQIIKLAFSYCAILYTFSN
ncbi:odorant receptor 4-like [Lutzomyia longipalpis]|uniref:odorant receptor 4-like n=1 Tax=Lutzomyia longipalpis TaxID=7200 RepID=UPI002483C7B6|nr:odorant receptor 4-like [Lutzomyia longipalpis]